MVCNLDIQTLLFYHVVVQRFLKLKMFTAPVTIYNFYHIWKTNSVFDKYTTLVFFNLIFQLLIRINLIRRIHLTFKNFMRFGLNNGKDFPFEYFFLTYLRINVCLAIMVILKENEAVYLKFNFPHKFILLQLHFNLILLVKLFLERRE